MPSESISQLTTASAPMRPSESSTNGNTNSASSVRSSVVTYGKTSSGNKNKKKFTASVSSGSGTRKRRKRTARLTMPPKKKAWVMTDGTPLPDEFKKFKHMDLLCMPVTLEGDTDPVDRYVAVGDE